MHAIVEIFKNSIYITGLVVIMMLVIEYFNVLTKGRQLHSLQHSPTRQVLLGALLGLIPGCMGGFAAVSLFTHNIFSFGALMSAMVSGTGDETFVMFATLSLPHALLIKLGLFVLAIALGLLVNVLARRKGGGFHFDHGLEVHVHEGRTERAVGSVAANLRRMSLPRFLLLACMLGFSLSLGLGLLEHDHAAHGGTAVCDHGAHADAACGPDARDDGHVHASGCEPIHGCDREHEHEHDQDCAHDHDHGAADAADHVSPAPGAGAQHHHGGILFSERWLNILFALVAAGAFLIVLAVEEHFLREHILRHIVYKHFMQIFLWTAGSLLFIHGLGLFVNLGAWVEENRLLMLLIAVAVGLIPQSGPHIVFINMFAGGQIAFSILLANSVVQNGHAGLPLLAASPGAFVKVKLIGAAVGLAVGLLGIAVGF